jgi:hypothetical protein
MTDLIQPITQIVGAMTGVGTFAIAALVLIRSNHLVQKVGEIHEQTNGMAAKLNEKTEIIAHAAGLQEGLTQKLGDAVTEQTALAPAAATAAALLLKTAAQAAELLAAKTLADAAAAKKE